MKSLKLAAQEESAALYSLLLIFNSSYGAGSDPALADIVERRVIEARKW